MIIIEGADGVGKSTLANRLSEKLGWPIHHMGVPDPDFDYMGGYLEKIVEYGPRCILDRFHLGAFVYGTILGLHSSGSSNKKLIWFTKLLTELEIQTLILYTRQRSFLYNLLYMNQKRELFSTNQILDANSIYALLANEGYCTFSWDVYLKGFPTSDKIIELMGLKA